MEDLWDDMENDDFEEIIDVILGIREDVKMSVSYTHLDVYKRQIRRAWRKSYVTGV